MTRRFEGERGYDDDNQGKFQNNGNGVIQRDDLHSADHFVLFVSRNRVRVTDSVNYHHNKLQ